MTTREPCRGESGILANCEVPMPRALGIFLIRGLVHAGVGVNPFAVELFMDLSRLPPFYSAGGWAAYACMSFVTDFPYRLLALDSRSLAPSSRLGWCFGFTGTSHLGNTVQGIAIGT